MSCRNWFLITWNQDASYKETPMEGRQPHGNLNPGPSHQPESFGTAVRLRTDAWQIWCVDPLLWPTFRNLGCTESSSVTPFAKEGMLHQLGFVALFHSHAVHTEHCSEVSLSHSGRPSDVKIWQVPFPAAHITTEAPEITAALQIRRLRCQWPGQHKGRRNLNSVE